MILKGLNRLGLGSKKYSRNIFRSLSSGSYEAKEISIPAHWGEVRGLLWEEPTPGPKKTIFGIHGWLDNAGTMNGIGGHLPPGYKFYCFDQPGCGLSSSCTDAWGYNHLHTLVWLKHLKETLGLKKEKVSLIAFSMGSSIAQFYACTFPTEIDKIVQIDFIHPMIHSAEHYFIGLNYYIRAAIKINKIIERNSNAPEYTYDEAIKNYIKSHTEMNGPNALTEKSAEILMERGMEKTSSGKYKWRHDPKMVNAPSYIVTQEMMDLIARNLKCPTLLIKASDSYYFIEPEQVERYLSLQRENNPLFQFVEVEGGHFVHLNNPERIVSHIHKFLSE